MSRAFLSLARFDEAGVRGPCGPAVRAMRREDVPEAFEVMSRGFVGSAFYRRLLGLDVRQFGIYWERFLPFALAHPAARCFVLEVSGNTRGVIAVALDGFAAPLRGFGFAAGLALHVSPVALHRYLGFVRFYERFMEPDPPDRLREARGLWLAVDRRPGDPPLGSRLVRGAIDALRAEGRDLPTGMTDGSDRGLLAFYRRLGFTIEPAVRFRGCAVVRVLRRPGEEG